MTASPASSASTPDPQRRHDPLLDEWVLVSAGRTQRPWHGAEEADAPIALPTYDPACHLCPGNVRAGGTVNPTYDATFVFGNDFSALRPDSSLATVEDGLLRAEGERGECRVVCYSPRHDLTLGAMATPEVRRVIDVWADQSRDLGSRYRWVQVLENRGAAMGASNPHPHGQIWAGTALPVMPAREVATQRAYLAETGRQLLADYAAQESGGVRVVHETEAWLTVVPFWARWPFETLIVPKRPAARLDDLDDDRRNGLADAIRHLIAAYDGLFARPFPYSMGWHEAPYGPADAGIEPAWQLHGHVYPPLLRASVRKFMVGYELLAEAQRDITPEEAAERLRAVGAP